MDNVIPKDVLGTLLKPIRKKFNNEVEKIRSERLVPGGKVFNYTSGLSDVASYPRQQKFIELVDGGMGGGLPYAPLSRPERNGDIIVMCDVSETAKDAPALKKAEEYAKKHSLPFPTINWNKAGAENVSVFGDPADLTKPVIIYIPRIKNKDLPSPHNKLDLEQEVKGFANTMKFKYSDTNAKKLIGWAQATMEYASETIMDVVMKRIEERMKSRKLGRAVVDIEEELS